MSDSGAFCPSCGSSVDPTNDRPRPGSLDGGDSQPLLCDACYFERFDFVDAPDRVEVTLCASCGAVKDGDEWTDVGATDYTDVAVEAVTDALGVHVDADDVAWGVEPEQVDPTTIRMHATFSGTVRGTPVEESVTIPVRIGRGTCTRCGRIAGDYYASIVQVRARDRTPTAEERDRAVEIATEVVESMTEGGDRNAFVTEVGEVEGGLDIKVSTSAIGRKIASRLIEQYGGSMDASETLVTEDGDGNGVYRVTYAVRLPTFVPGDVIDPGDDGGPVLVRNARGALTGRRLGSGERFEEPGGAAALEDARRLGDRTEAEETTLVAVEDEHAVQVLDPETYRATTIPRPADLDPDEDTVRVLKHRDGLHVIPDE